MADRLYLYTDSSGTAHAVADLGRVPKKHRSRAVLVPASPEPERPSMDWRQIRGPFFEILLPLAALIFAWRRYHTFFARAAIIAVLAIWGYFQFFDRMTGLGMFKTAVDLQQQAPAEAQADDDAADPPLSSVDETGMASPPPGMGQP